MLPRRSSWVICAIFCPSTKIFPACTSKNLNISLVIVDLPEPECPTKPILWPDWIFRSRPLKTFLLVFGYLNSTELNSISPLFILDFSGFSRSSSSGFKSSTSVSSAESANNCSVLWTTWCSLSKPLKMANTYIWPAIIVAGVILPSTTKCMDRKM